MKRIYLLVIIGFTAYACNLSSHQLTSVEVKAKVEKEILIDNLSIIVKGVSDSRCPEGCQCCWAGEAKVFFTLKDQDFVLDTSLVLPSRTLMNYKHYRIELKSVSPYPICNYEFSNDYTIQFNVNGLKNSK